MREVPTPAACMAVNSLSCPNWPKPVATPTRTDMGSVKIKMFGRMFRVTSAVRLKGADDEPRFAILETIREYGLERLEVSGESGPVQERHATYFASVAEALRPHLYGPDQVRFIGGGDFAERSLSCIAEVPQGALVWIMEGDAGSVLGATDAAAADSLAALDGRSPLGMLAFDCIARRGVLGDDGIQAEIDRLATLAEGAPVAGFYTYGEIARTRGLRGFHNQTLVVLSLA